MHQGFGQSVRRRGQRVAEAGSHVGPADLRVEPPARQSRKKRGYGYEDLTFSGLQRRRLALLWRAGLLSFGRIERVNRDIAQQTLFDL